MSEQLRSEPLAAPAPDLAAVQRRTVWVLSAGQVLGGVGVGAGIAVGGLLAARLAGTAAVAGLTQTTAVLGAAVIAIPVSRLMSRSGRRPGMMAAYASAVLGCAIVVLAAALGSFPAMLPGMFLLGAGTTAGLQARFAATDLATPERRGRSLALVVWATTLGAVLGPNLSEPAGRLAIMMGLPELSGPFVVAAVLFLGAFGALSLLRPDPLLLARREAGGDPSVAAARLSVRDSLAAIVATGNGRLGLAAVVAAQSVMVAVMVLTPVHLDDGGVGLRVIGLVISVHIAGMYALSPVVGWIADRAGRRGAVLIGVGVLSAALVVSGTAAPDAAVQLGVGLFLLGLGWSFGLIAGSTLVTESVPLPVRPFAQGATDLTMGLCAAVAGALAGPILAWADFGGLTAAAGVLVVPVAVLALAGARFSPGRGTA
ncbi:MAG: MFS transporter [Geodermatophilaceae bacterium]